MNNSTIPKWKVNKIYQTAHKMWPLLLSFTTSHIFTVNRTMYLISYHDFIYITTCIYKHLYNEHHNNLHKRHFKHDTNIHTDYIFLIIISQVVTSIKRYIDQSVSQYLILLFKVSQFEKKNVWKDTIKDTLV